MSRRLSRFSLQFLSLVLAPAMFPLAHAAGPLTVPNSVIQSNAASSGNGFNSLSAEDRRKLLAAPDGDAPANAAGAGLNLKDNSYCKELQQQIARAQQAAPAAAADTYPAGQARNDPNRRYQPAGGNVLQYDERSKLEARYHSECNK
ncbi:MAG: hypothetical protein JWQ61_77 [Collimonas fungivorans]|nr:hypothetical protein [Collimonas fungivorans]